METNHMNGTEFVVPDVPPYGYAEPDTKYACVLEAIQGLDH